ncbi:hypothetical protein JXM83_05630 [Candidatus Woesearchaeota archaeon]|nr:hypothetical protein [Candidatus Woesearchaeota archaeon]
MEPVSLIELAKKEIYNANYLYTVTLPLVNEPKLLLSVLTRIQKALEYAITELVDLEIKYKFVESHGTSFDSKYDIFKLKLVDFYRIDKKYVNLIEQIRTYATKHKNSPVEFTKNDSFIICDNNYNVLVLSKSQISVFLQDSKSFINIVDTCVSGRDVFHR